MAKRNYPNNYFAWYNDDKRLAIICEAVSGSSCSLSQYNNRVDCEANGGTWNVGGSASSERYDTYQGADVSAGLRLTYHSKYEEVLTSTLTSELSTTNGIDTGMQECIVMFVKARLYEDMGDLQKAQYYRAMYEKELKQYPSRKSGVRVLSVPYI